MKRSEMVQLIKEIAEHQISEKVADRILTGLEEIGMLPPELPREIMEKVCAEEMGYASYEQYYIETGEKPWNEWESEE